MARPGFTGHRKYARLTRLLGSAPLALGCLELMWEKCCINGDDYLGDVVDVEAAAQWPGEPGALCRALLDAGGEDRAGFIEEVEGHPEHYRCHDFYDHAPRYVARRMEREAERRERGQTLSDLRAEAGSKGGKQTASKRPANGQQNDSKRKQTAVPPAPAPAPAPAPLRACAEPAEADSTPKVLLSTLELQVLDHWQLVAVPMGLPKVLKVSPKLIKAIDVRLKDPAWLDLFREAVTFAARHPAAAWMRGEGTRAWKVSLEWLLKPDKAEEVAAKARASPGRAGGIAADVSTQAQVQLLPVRRLLPAGAP